MKYSVSGARATEEEEAEEEEEEGLEASSEAPERE